MGAGSSRQPQAPYRLPLVPSTFTGRDEELAQLCDAIDDTDAGPVIVVLGGPPGCGATTLAARFLSQHADRYPGGILYAQLSTAGRLAVPHVTEILGGFLRALGVPADAVPADRTRLRALYREITAARPVAVLGDNVVDWLHVRALLPSAAGGLLLLTAREGTIGIHDLVEAWDAYTLPLDPLPPGPAATLLRRLAGTARLDDDPAATAALVDACGGSPRALAIVGTSLRAHPGRSVAELAAAIAPAPGWPTSLPWRAYPMRTIFDTAYADLDPEAARAYRYLSLHRGPWLTIEAAAAMLDRPRAATQALLDRLAEATLLTEHQGGRFGFDLRAYQHATELRQSCDETEDTLAALRRLVTHYRATATAADAVLDPHRPHISPAYNDLPAPSPFPDAAAARGWFESDMDNIVAAVLDCHALGWCTLCWQIVEATWSYLEWARPIDTWRRLHDCGLAAARHAGDPRAEARMHLQAGAGELLARQPRLAYLHGMRALRLADETGDTDLEAHARDQLAQCMLAQDRPFAALSHIRDALRLTTARTRAAVIYQRRLGETYLALGMPRSAIGALDHATQLADELGDPVLSARIRVHLGQAHLHAREPEHAIARLRAAITDLATDNTPASTADLADALEHLADALLATGELEEARERLLGAHAIHRDRHDTAATHRVQTTLDALQPSPEQP
ncbi:AAA family ATPase [Amycolatopsis sp. NPDC059021]|uniref:AAA family ATPase n=1 Tax=Amycolatopsis sp. NPDC059021 TaxID=3346704 RepID=UPI00366D483B